MAGSVRVPVAGASVFAGVGAGGWAGVGAEAAGCEGRGKGEEATGCGWPGAIALAGTGRIAGGDGWSGFDDSGAALTWGGSGSGVFFPALKKM